MSKTPNMNTKKILKEMKLGDIVTQNPSLALEFEKRSLDYCCQGSRTLEQAADKAGLDAQTLAEELTQAIVDEPPEEWSKLSPIELIENIESVHHAYLWDNFDRIEALVEKIAKVHGERHEELIEVESLYSEIRKDLEPHLRKEEQVLFPMIRRISESAHETEAEELVEKIQMINDEHEPVGELLTQLNSVTSGYTTPADGCATYAACYQALAEFEADIHLHIHKESNVLFPALNTKPVKGWAKA
jgi:regulator of cell morphogenesis and NO signaling